MGWVSKTSSAAAWNQAVQPMPAAIMGSVDMASNQEHTLIAVGLEPLEQTQAFQPSCYCLHPFIYADLHGHPVQNHSFSLYHAPPFRQAKKNSTTKTQLT